MVTSLQVRRNSSTVCAIASADLAHVVRPGQALTRLYITTMRLYTTMLLATLAKRPWPTGQRLLARNQRRGNCTGVPVRGLNRPQHTRAGVWTEVWLGFTVGSAAARRSARANSTHNLEVCPQDLQHLLAPDDSVLLLEAEAQG